MLRDLLRNSAAARALRVDEFVEEQHPRDQGGRFAAEASAREAESHAVRARSAASGTTPAARASARKAEEHSSLARAAADRGDSDAAARHLTEASRHADAAVAKAAATGLARVTPSSGTSPRPPAPSSPIATPIAKAPTATPIPSSAPTATPIAESSPIAGALATIGTTVRGDLALIRDRVSLGDTRKSTFGRPSEKVLRDHARRVLGDLGLQPTSRMRMGSQRVKVADLKGARGNYTSADDVVRVSPPVARGIVQFIQHPSASVANDYKTLIHEAIHSHGNVRIYDGSGFKSEEVSTEVLARRVVREALGITPGQASMHVAGVSRINGSYQPLINGVADAIAEELSRSGHQNYSDVAHEAMERGALEYKRQSSKTPLSGLEQAHRFGDAIVANLPPEIDAGTRERVRSGVRKSLQ